MTTQDQQNLLFFLRRPLMFMYVWDKNSIVSFLAGYEFGSLGKCEFQKQLKEWLSKNYKERYSADGWPGQLGRLAKKSGKTWEETFQMVALEILEPTPMAS